MEMDATATTPATPSERPGRRMLRLPLGLLGLERIKEYELLADPAEDPFLWLQAAHDPDLAFIVVPPQPLFPGYLPEISPEDAAFLGATTADELALLCIVTLRGPHQATVNLKGPLVVNRRTLLAKQVIPSNAAEFSVQHPLPVAQP